MEAHTNPGTYPGNPSLPREVKEKILSTFRHTLNLFKEGKLDDCLIGCDFILKMDARFAPARQLLEKARNPSADIDIAQLEALVATTPTRQERVVAADPDRLLVRAVESFNARDFDAAISAAEQVLAVLPGNRDAVEILEKARSKKTAQPVFDGSRQRALAALEENRHDDARRELDQMRGLDPDHPAVALLERRIGPAPAPVPPPPASPPPPPDFGGLDLDFSDTAETSGGFGHSTEQPDIRFDDGRTVSLKIPPESLHATSSPPLSDPSGLDALSLDSLSLDLPPSVAPVGAPPSDARSSLRGPLHDVPPAVAPGSPADMWADAGAGLNLDEGGSSSSPEPFSSTPMSGMSEPSAPGAGGREPEEEDSAAGEREIAGLLKQGDDAARRGERQQAIEVWSRIFLIDINNSEAVTRIEKARQEMAEGNRRISDGLKTGREAYERGDLSGARELFLEVLAVDENEPTARFYLDRIQAEMANPGGAAAEGEETDAYAPQADVPDSAGSSAAAAAPVAPARRSVRFPVSRRIIAMVGLFLALVLGFVYFLVWRAPRPAASAAAPAAAPAAAAPGPAAAGGSGSLARARQLLGAGKIGEARLELRRVPPSSPDHAEAQSMLTDLGKSGAPGPAVVAVDGAGPASVAGAPPSEADGEPARMRIAAERALKDKRYIEALKTFSQAAPAFKNDPTFAQSMGVAAEKVTALTPAVKLYNEGEYETAIPVLWRIFQEDRDNQDARTYLLRAYYNQGVTQLQNGLYPKAIQSFGEALTIDPADAEAIRHRKFAERYLKSDLDLMGRIYVRHLNHRP